MCKIHSNPKSMVFETDFNQYFKFTHTMLETMSQTVTSRDHCRTESAKGSLHYRGSVLRKKDPFDQIRQRPNLGDWTLLHGKYHFC